MFRRSRGAVESEIRAHSANARRTDLVRAVVCAGMFPNIAIIDQRKNRAGFRTLDDGKVNPHPSSVIAADRFFSGRFLAYSQKVKTKDINLMMSTVVSDHALLFFGGSVSRGDRGTLTMLDGKVSFNMGDEAAELILRAREELEGLLERKVRDPKMDLDKESRHLVVSMVVARCDQGKGQFEW